MIRAAFASVLAFGLLATWSVAEDEFGFAPGKKVPNRGMSVVHGALDGKHTCLTGRYRKQRAVSVYASVVDADVLRVMQVVDESIADSENDRGFLLVLAKKTENREFQIRRMVSDAELEHVDVAMAKPMTTWKDFDFSKHVTVIDSDQRVIRIVRTYDKSAITNDALAELRRSLAKPGLPGRD